MGILRVFAVPDHLVWQSAGRDRLVPEAHSRFVGRDGDHDRPASLRGAVSVSAVAQPETQSTHADDDRDTDYRDAHGRSDLDDRARLWRRQLGLAGCNRLVGFRWIVAGGLHVAVGETIADSDK